MGMRREQKRSIAGEIQGKLRDAGTVYLADFTGLDVEAMGELRSKLLEQGVELRVVKNTLARRALEDLDYPDLRDQLQGPTALVLGADDPVVPAKVVKEFAREHDDRPVVKVGVVERRVVTADEVGRLADLPSRDELLGAIAGGLTASVGGIAGVLAAVIRDVALLIEEVAKAGDR